MWCSDYSKSVTKNTSWSRPAEGKVEGKDDAAAETKERDRAAKKIANVIEVAAVEGKDSVQQCLQKQFVNKDKISKH